MGDIWFYHLEHSALEAVLPDLLTKTLSRGWRALVHVGSPERLKALDSHLWTYTDDSFLPHGVAGGAHDADQPVLLTTDNGTGNAANANGAQVLFLVDRAPFPEGGPPEGHERVVVLFDGRDPEALAEARSAWKALKDTGAALSYWQQSPVGKWEKKA
ncbi:MAG: DNA polymerase III subunit chi [Alphaproteobacteria bacterium]